MTTPTKKRGQHFPSGIQCPKCNRKGLHYAPHPHAFGRKDRSVIQCRFCQGRFPAAEIEKLNTP